MNGQPFFGSNLLPNHSSANSAPSCWWWFARNLRRRPGAGWFTEPDQRRASRPSIWPTSGHPFQITLSKKKQLPGRRWPRTGGSHLHANHTRLAQNNNNRLFCSLIVPKKRPVKIGLISMEISIKFGRCSLCRCEARKVINVISNSIYIFFGRRRRLS